jgi:hypothetical protein
MRPQHRGMYARELGACRVYGRARGQPAEEVRHAVFAIGIHGGPKMMRARHHVGDQLGLRRIRHRRFEDTDHCRDARTEIDRLIEHRRIAAQHVFPEPMRQHDRTGSAGTIIGRRQQSAEHRAQAHDLEERPVDHARLDQAGLEPESDHRELDGREVAERGDCRRARLEVVDLGHGERHVLERETFGGLADVDQPIGFAVDERPKEHAANHGEDGGVGADAEGKRDHHRGRQRLGAEQ